MNIRKSWYVVSLLSMLPLSASAAVDSYLQIKGGKGEMRVVHCTDGACVVASLAPGGYTVLVCDAQGKVIPTEARYEYTVVSPRDQASGMATGKRMHEPFTITKEWGRGRGQDRQVALEHPE